MNTTADLIYQEAKDLPEPEAQEVLDFVAFLKARRGRGKDETAYLLKEPANARRLLEAVANIRSGRHIEERELLPDD